MDNILILIFSVGWLIILILALVCFWALLRLKNKHAKLWDKLDRPGIFYRNNPKIWKPFIKFIEQKEYLHLDDQKLITILNFMRKAKNIGIIVKIYAVVFVVYFLLKGLS